jgi:hypothetical protein
MPKASRSVFLVPNSNFPPQIPLQEQALMLAMLVIQQGKKMTELCRCGWNSIAKFPEFLWRVSQGFDAVDL